MSHSRRRFLALGVATASSLQIASVFPSVAQAAATLTLSPLTGRLSLVSGGAANVVVATSGQELLLVDGGAAADANALQKLLARHYPGQRMAP